MQRHSIDITEMRSEKDKCYLFVAIDQTSKFAFARLMGRMDRTAMVAGTDEETAKCPSLVTRSYAMERHAAVQFSGPSLWFGVKSANAADRFL